MPFHHTALATRDMAAIHRFYETGLGFPLVKVEIARTPGGGWAKHFFYDIGDGQFVAFWELHDETLPQEFPTGLSSAAGLPEWVNHLAFRAADEQELERRALRWLEMGHDVLEIDHHWCRSVYARDPNGTLVEFCTTTGSFRGADRDRALEALRRDDLPLSPEPGRIRVRKAADHVSHAPPDGD